MKLSEIVNPNNNKLIAWYPSSGLDFRDLLVLGQKKFVFDKNVFANELFEFDVLPEIFIHTDNAYSNENWSLNKLKSLYKDDISEYFLMNIEDVVSDLGKVVGKFLSIKISSILLETEIEQKVLFLFSDNIDFFRNYIVKDIINIDFLINIRDGASENGGAEFSLKFLEFYLGIMNTKYLISDNFGREPIDVAKCFEDVEMKNFYFSEDNKPIVLQGLKEWSWSEFGIFGGDAFLMKIHRF